MRRYSLHHRFGSLVAGATVAGLLASCASGGPPSTTVSPSLDQAPSSTVVPSAEPTEAIETWDLVWFSDSSGNFVADLWGARIEEAVGVDVRVHDFAGSGEIGSAVLILEAIRTDAAVREAVAAAEVIGLYTNPGHTEAGDRLFDSCADPVPGVLPDVYTSEDFAPFGALLREIYDEILALRAGQPTVIRAMDLWVPMLEQWIAAGVEPACTAGWEAWTTTLREVAAEHGVPTASMYDAFNGPGHDEDPVAMGYIGEDGSHPSAEGNAVQVDVLHALGYDPIEP